MEELRIFIYISHIAAPQQAVEAFQSRIRATLLVADSREYLVQHVDVRVHRILNTTDLSPDKEEKQINSLILISIQLVSESAIAYAFINSLRSEYHSYKC